MPANLENSAVATELEKVSFHSNPKECSNYHSIALISHTSKVMLKILQARLQQYVNHELPDVQAGFRKDRETRDQIANIRRITEKAREFQKSICFIEFPGGSDGKRLSTMWVTWCSIPGLGISLEKETATHSSTLAWKIPWIEEPGRLQSMGLQRVGHD